MSRPAELMAASQWSDFWTRSPMERIPFLVELRQLVLEQSNTRMPKWRLLYAPDLAIEIHPRPEFALMQRGEPMFKWSAMHGGPGGERPDEGWISTPTLRPPGAVVLKGTIYLRDTAWWFNPRRLWQRDETSEALFTFRQRVFAALQGTQLGGASATSLLSPHCLICGRGLTDPVSEARMIGPECAGRHPVIPTVRVPLEPVR